MDDAYLITLVGVKVVREVVIIRIPVVMLRLAACGDYCLCCQIDYMSETPIQIGNQKVSRMIPVGISVRT